ncbi:hypothetical protein G9A89_020170 [Geosiphon pyriformis]|nr:hypothetical protein G9A89_020170 [Geosiphon pyriformis]
MSASLLAIMLVIDNSRGHHFVFHYPKDPKRRVENISAPQNDSVDQDLERNNDLLGSYFINWPYTPSDDAEKRIGRSRFEDEPDETENIIAKQGTLQGASENESHGRAAFEEKLFGFKTSFLADILSPKLKSSKKFQLTIDELTFVGQPVFLSSDRSGSNNESTKIEYNTKGAQSPNQKNLELFQENGHESLEDPCAAPSDNNHSPNSTMKYSKEQQSHLTLFHLVFVLEPPELELNRQIENIYKHVITKLTAALRYEQLRCDYVLIEAEKILSIKDEGMIANKTFDDIMETTIKQSSLAKTIAQVYHSISSDSIAHVIINDYIDLSLQIPPLAPSLFFSPLDNDRDWYEYAHFPVIAPYHTLLLLEDPEEILKSMPLDANPTLVQLIQILTPTQRLADLCTLLDCSLAQIYRLAAHLIYWRKAKLINVISVRNVYVISPTADLNSLSSLNADFNHIFDRDLFGFLALLATPKPYAGIIPSKDHRTMYLEVITYLLRKDIVVQLHAYFLIMIPHHIKLGLSLEEYEEKMRNTSVENESNGLSPIISDNNALISAPEQASPIEKEWLKRKTLNQPKEIDALFERLIKYFNGKHHVEEILFRENISRRDLKMVNLQTLFSPFPLCDPTVVQMHEPSRSVGPDTRVPVHDVQQSRLKASEKTRNNPLTDLIETEKQYVEDLKCLLQRVTACWSPDNLPPAELDAIFRYMEEIYRQNKRFCSKLVKIGANPQSPEDLGDTLMAWIDDMEAPYTQYCQHFLKGFDNWLMIEEHEALQQTLISITAERNRPVSLDFFFEMPLTRLHYYKKLYMRLLKSTEPGRSDHDLLAAANERLDILVDMEKQAKSRIQTGPAVLATLPFKQLSKDVVPNSPKSPVSPQKKKIQEINAQQQSLSPQLPRSPKSPNSQGNIPQPPLSPRLPKSMASENFMDKELSAPSSLNSPFQNKFPQISDFSRQINWNYGLKELEEQLNISRVKDLFTKQPRNVKIALRPPNLPFQREIRLHDNFIVIIQHEDQPIMHKAHLFLLTDLLLICQILNPEEKQKNPNFEFFLLYPPLSGKHLTVKDLVGSKDDLLELKVMKREKIIIRAENESLKNVWLRALGEIIDFAIKASVKPQVKTDPRSLKAGPNKNQQRSPLSANSMRSLNSENTSPHESVPFPQTNTENQLLSPPGIRPQLPQHLVGPQSPASSNINPQFSTLSGGDDHLKQQFPFNPTLHMNSDPRQPPNSATNLNNGYPLKSPANGPITRSRTPDPPRNAGGQYPGDYNPYPAEQGGRRNDPMGTDSRVPNRQRSNSINSLASVETIAKTRETIYQTPPSKVFIWKENTWKPLTTKERCIIEVRLTNANRFCWAIILEKSGRMVLNAWIVPTTTLHRETPTDLSISCEIGQTKEYYRINTPHPIEADRFLQSLNKAKHYENEKILQVQNIPQNLSLPTPPQIMVSRSSSLQAQEAIREVEQTVTQVMETRCRVFLQNDHGVWTNLNWGHMKLSLETPSHRKRIVISSDKQHTKLIDAILSEDGVTRVGKTGVAITLPTLGFIYMLQMKEEKTAIKAFELMKERGK